MKTLLDIKKECVEVPNEKMENVWLKIQYLFSTWNISEEEIYSFDFKKFSYDYWENENFKDNKKNKFETKFEAKFLKAIIMHSLDIKSIFWENTFDIKFFRREEVTPYDTDVYESFEFWLYSKREVMHNLKGEQIFENIKDLNDFIEDPNNIRDKLLQIKDLFYVKYEKKY